MLAQAQLSRLSYRNPRLGRPHAMPDVLKLQNVIFGGPSYMKKVLSTGPIAYWMGGESGGSTAFCQVLAAQNGQHTGVTLGQAGIGDGRTCPFYDGANDYTAIHTATFAGRFNGAEGSMLIWCRVANAGVWTDEAARYLTQLYADVNNSVALWKAGTDNTMYLRYKAGGVNSAAFAGDFTTTDWFCLLLTWSAAADEVKGFRNGAQLGDTQTDLGTWAGSIAQAALGAQNTSPNAPWHGWQAHNILWDYALSPSTAQKLATV